MINKSYLNEKKVWTFSLSLSLIINLTILAVLSIYWLSVHYVPKPLEKFIVIQVLEIPSPKKPVTTMKQPMETNVAELDPMKELRNNTIDADPSVKSELSTQIEQKREQVSVPKPPVDLPDSEMILEKGSPSGAKLTNPGEEINVPENLKWQGVVAETTMKSKFEENGQSTRLAHLAEQGANRIESTVGETLATGDLVAPSGIIDRKSPFSKRPISIIIENAPQARPQSGLSKADIVYEIMAEGGITRFLAIFGEENADNVGPVRSARPYFVMKAVENNA
ncbi:MAG: DUF3048 domain-containing protein, partial [Atribacterota bacterium]